MEWLQRDRVTKVAEYIWDVEHRIDAEASRSLKGNQKTIEHITD